MTVIISQFLCKICKEMKVIEICYELDKYIYAS